MYSSWQNIERYHLGITNSENWGKSSLFIEYNVRLARCFATLADLYYSNEILRLEPSCKDLGEGLSLPAPNPHLLEGEEPTKPMEDLRFKL